MVAQLGCRLRPDHDSALAGTHPLGTTLLAARQRVSFELFSSRFSGGPRPVDCPFVRVRRSLRRPIGRLLVDTLALVGAIAGWVSDKTPAVAIGGLVLVYVLMALIAGPLGRALGLPRYQPDEAYSVTLDRWRRARQTPPASEITRSN